MIGQPAVSFASSNPNVVESRSLYEPRGIALDRSATPPRLYVSDTNNNRVLGWNNAAAFSNGAPADIVIGQRDEVSTVAWGPGTNLARGLTAPTGLAVDPQGNLYVVDAGNHRILFYDKPFDPAIHPDKLKLPSKVIGQADFDHDSANRGGQVSAEGINTPTTYVLGSRGVGLNHGLFFDSSGNLWFADAGNSRVLRYPSDGAGGVRPTADMVLGQSNMTTNTQGSSGADKTRLRLPTAVMRDDAGRIFVADEFGRVLVFSENPLPAGTTALRILGIVVAATPPPRPNNIQLDGLPKGLVMIGNNPAVVDTFNSRIMVFDPYPQWPADAPNTSSPAARDVIGQPDFSTNKNSAANNGLAAPFAAVYSGTELFVADAGNNRVVVFPGSSKTAQRVLGQTDFGLSAPNIIVGQELYFRQLLDTPRMIGAGVAVDARSDPPRLYIADSGNNRVLGYKDARRVRTGAQADIVIGQPDLQHSAANYHADGTDTPADNTLQGPIGLAADKDGNLYVADAGNSRVLRFPKPNFDQPVSMPRANLVLGQQNFTTVVRDPTRRTMSFPFGLALTPEGSLLVSDPEHNRILLFKNTGSDFTNGMNASSIFGQPDEFSTGAGTALSRLNIPQHIATDTSGRLYVADSNNSRILVFTELSTAPAAGASAVMAITAATSNSALRFPQGIVVRPSTGEILVSDATILNNARRIIRYPEFTALQLLGNPVGTAMIATAGTAALALDPYDNVIAAEDGHRVEMFFPALFANNAANFLPDLNIPSTLSMPCCTPGMWAVLWPWVAAEPFGSPFASIDETHAPSVPLPKDLADIQVIVSRPDGPEIPSALVHVKSGQINFQVPKNLPTEGDADVQVIRKSTGQILATGALTLTHAAPGLFMKGETDRPPGITSGTAMQVAALNQDYTCNGKDATGADPAACKDGIVRPARPGEIIQLYANGPGVIPGAPEDGEASNAQETSQKPTVVIGTAFANVEWSGLTPTTVALWQINVKIPDNVAPGAARVVVQMRDKQSSIGTYPLTVIHVQR